MSTYAVLGATGNCGSSLVKILQQNPKAQIHALVRSKAKLESLIPGITSDSRVTIFEGPITAIPTLTLCLRDTHAAFLAVAASENIPNCHIAQDTAESVVAALSALRAEDTTFTPPRLIILSSSLLEPGLCRDLPRAARSLMLMAASNVFEDLRRAEAYLRAQTWLACTFVKPGGLVHDVQRGHELSTERQKTFLSWLDLAAGMVEVADAEAGRWAGENVSVVPTGGRVKVEWRAPLVLFKGLLFHFVPGLYPYLVR